MSNRTASLDIDILYQLPILVVLSRLRRSNIWTNDSLFVAVILMLAVIAIASAVLAQGNAAHRGHCWNVRVVNLECTVRFLY